MNMTVLRLVSWLIAPDQFGHINSASSEKILQEYSKSNNTILNILQNDLGHDFALIKFHSAGE